jgi:alpha-glucosidase (family GH31 glycosyl hydrolase)
MKEPIDAFGYNAQEFNDWWKESIHKMIKRTKRRKTKTVLQMTPAEKHSSRKISRRRSRDMEVSG